MKAWWRGERVTRRWAAESKCERKGMPLRDAAGRVTLAP